MQKSFFNNLILLIGVNLLVKPLAIFGIDASVQNAVGSEVYGGFAALLNFSFLFNILADFGINNFTTRKVATEHLIDEEYVGKVSSLRIFLFFLYVMFTLSIGWLIGYQYETWTILPWLLLNQGLITVIAFCRSHFSGMHWFKYEALFSVLDRLLLIVSCGTLLLVAYQDFDIRWFVWTQTISYGITAIIAWFLLKRFAPKIKLAWDNAFNRQIISSSWPYALLIVLMMLYNRVDSVMIERLHVNGDFQAGIYAQGFRILDALFMFAMLFSNLLYPMFSRLLGGTNPDARKQLQELFMFSFQLLLSGSILVGIWGFFNGEAMLEFIYNQDTELAAPPFQLLSLTFIGICLTLLSGTLLTANANFKILNRLALVGLVVNILLNAVLIPKHGAWGASVATCITQSAIGLIQSYWSLKTCSISLNGKVLGRLVVFSSLVLMVIYFCQYWGISSLVSLAIGVLLLLVLRIVDWKHFQALFSRPIEEKG